VTVSVICLVYALRGVDVAVLRNVFLKYSKINVAAVLFIFALCVWIQALRLSLLFDPGLGVLNALKAVLVGLGFNNVLPAKGGEVVKVAYVSKFLNRPASTATAAVFLERFLDANCLYFLSILVLGDMINQSVKWWAGAFFVIFWSLFVFFRVRHDVLLKIWGLFTLLGHVRYLDEPRIIPPQRMSQRQILAAVVSTAGVWVTYFAYSASAFVVAGNFPISLEDAAVIFLVSAAGQLVPSSPGSLGVFEASIVWSAGVFGVEREQALGIAFLMRVIQFLPTAAAIVFMAGRRREFREVA
jgi:uncharacterized membrane protein YbhN (UPF0104 family)